MSNMDIEKIQKIQKLKQLKESVMNISPELIKGDCELKCAFSFTYPTSNTTATNNGFFITLSYDKKNTDPVVFNTEKYYVEQINLYSPSVHLFNGRPVAAELVIEHFPSAGGQPLKVGIPLTVSGNQNIGSVLLSQIIKKVAQEAPAQGESTNINLDNFTLQPLVPRKPFVSYTEESGTNWIVYTTEHAIGLRQEVLETLSKILIQPTEITCKSGPMLFINKKGPTNAFGSDIYIDCKPIDSSGEEEVVTDTSSSESSSEFYKSDEFKAFIKILLLVIIFIVFFALMYYGFKNLSNIKLPTIIKGSAPVVKTS